MKVIEFPKEEKITADDILEESKGRFEEALICGYTAEGELLMVFNTGDMDLLYTMLSRVREKILDMGYE